MMKKNEPEWQNNDGEYLRLADMDQFYLSNCIRLVKDNPGWRDHMLEPLEYELKLRKSRWTTTPFKRKTNK